VESGVNCPTPDDRALNRIEAVMSVGKAVHQKEPEPSGAMRAADVQDGSLEHLRIADAGKPPRSCSRTAGRQVKKCPENLRHLRIAVCQNQPTAPRPTLTD
jgi:hypothetical protein